MNSTPSPQRASGTSATAVLDLIRLGRANSRAEIARETGLSPSTVAQRIDELITTRRVREAGEGSSRGGRRPRTLEVDPTAGVVCAVDLGSQHAKLALLDLAGHMLAVRTERIDISDGAHAIVSWIATLTDELVTEHAAPGQTLRGYGVGLPGPVDAATGLLVSPSRMPGWNGVDVAALMTEITGVPAVVDNDANIMALGEHDGLHDDVQHLVFVKIGSSIGCGVIAAGTLHRGHRGVAGDISHVAVPGAPAVLCSCGRTGCLDAVAGGAAIIRALREAGVDVSEVADVLALARDAHPLVTQMLREAGARVGGVLATIMNFFNPQQLVLGGTLGEAEAFVAGVRSAIYLDCLPMITDCLEISVSGTKDEAGVLGAGRLILDRVFQAPALSTRTN